MKKLIIIFTSVCLSLFAFSSCEAASNPSKNNAPVIEDGTKFKITYVVDSAYFTLPEDAPKYHIYGTDTTLPVPVEKNSLPNLMKAKFWSDGTKDGITVLGGRDYTSDITVEYKFSFDEEKCADGYIMIDGECKQNIICADDEFYDTTTDSCIHKEHKLGDPCYTNYEAEDVFIENGIVECIDGTIQFAGCKDGYNYVDGKCVIAQP